jgi:hypothetical protein
MDQHHAELLAERQRRRRRTLLSGILCWLGLGLGLGAAAFHAYAHVGVPDWLWLLPFIGGLALGCGGVILALSLVREVLGHFPSDGGVP